MTTHLSPNGWIPQQSIIINLLNWFSDVRIEISKHQGGLKNWPVASSGQSQSESTTRFQLQSPCLATFLKLKVWAGEDYEVSGSLGSSLLHFASIFHFMLIRSYFSCHVNPIICLVSNSWSCWHMLIICLVSVCVNMCQLSRRWILGNRLPSCSLHHGELESIGTGRRPPPPSLHKHGVPWPRWTTGCRPCFWRANAGYHEDG